MWFTVTSMLVLMLFASAGGSMVIMPGRSHKGALPPLSSEQSRLRDRLRQDVYLLGREIGERNTRHYRSLGLAAQHVSTRFLELGLPVREEPYRIEGKEMVNIEAELKGTTRAAEIVVIGAHYDSAPGSPGANDNASGVAAMLELARLFKDAEPTRTVRFIAFVNEEPPYFLTETMGSRVYARRARGRGDKIVAMLSLETIGYYSDRPKSQQYPAPLNLFYPDSGNFIGFVGDLSSRDLVRRAIGTFRKTTRFPSEGVAAPGAIPGIGWSDHWSFWQAGYPAIMITDTALFRYPHYHAPSDTPEKLDYERMARVVLGIGRVVEDLINK
ncbi:MAG: aminopeptidase [Geobacteraceae bacterium GWC2_58_44]|nr:MAG: aminopeptidase [Geobacteraceae bacterium GWC2_58_44]